MRTKHDCLKCGEPNEIIVMDIRYGLIQECETICVACGYKDYWKHGEYVSENDKIEGKSEKII